jgi:OHCU decarboxylase
MRSDPADYELVAPGSLQGVLALLAKEPGVWLPIAGGTDLMVLFGAGALGARKLVSIWNLRELRRVDESPEEIAIGAGCSYTDLREHRGIAREFPLLTRAAAWTGGIANQNRGTIGGNIANASPAADCLPALLVYDAELTLASIRGERRLAYRTFHTGYKKTAMAADELIRAIHLKKKFAGYFIYTRKVGARQSQAIAKVNIAALGRVAVGGSIVEDARIALGSVAPVPLRLDKTERLLIGKNAKELSADDLRRQVAAEIAPIADIRSTAHYRTAVAGNLVCEFLDRLLSHTSYVSQALARWNRLGLEEASQSILPCCGAQAWADAVAARRPFETVSTLLETSQQVWREAFGSHPRIGESRTEASDSEKSHQWSSQEQHQIGESDEAVKLALAEGNAQYERRFGRIFVVCATGKSPGEILAILRRRLQNGDDVELAESAKEQEQIMQIRLRKWLEE